MPKANQPQEKTREHREKVFYLEFLTPAQKLAWNVYQNHDVIFLLGPAGTGKSHLAVGFALQELFAGEKKNIIITRPIVEAGENLGFLPGTLDEKVDPYMMPLYDCLAKMVGKGGQTRAFVEERLEVAPLAYMRGRTFEQSVCILDEAQNCSMAQLTLFLTRLGEGSKMVITGDPDQSDLFDKGRTPIAEMMDLLSSVEGVGVVEFPEKYIVRHPLVGKILKRLKDARK
jgi:phosphate starvation-inducible PhoH-like protein